MGLTGRDIVCLSTHYWDERRFRKQEFMSRFAAAGNRVLYVEPSFSMARRPEEHLRDVATNRLVRARLERREENVHLLKPPRGLPRWSDPRVERINYRWYARIVARAADRLGFRDTILWVYRPSFAPSLDAIPHAGVVFDLVDDLAAYGGDQHARLADVERSVVELVARSDLLVATARPLIERYGERARRVVHVPNGFSASTFLPERAGERVPEDVADLPRPILGFIGTLFGFLDFELLEGVARAHADKTMVLVGPVEASVEGEVARLTRLPNVVHLGPRPQPDIPAYVAAFDLCLNPFRRSRTADSVNPLKVWEYLAMGKAVVSTPMRGLQMEEPARLVAFGEDAAAFSAEVDRLLRDDGPELREARRGAVEDYSWDRLFERLTAACEDALTR